MSVGAPGEVVLPRRVLPQPTPDVVAGGDCGACVLGGLLGWSSVERVYDVLVGKRQSISEGEMARILRYAVQHHGLDRALEEPAEWRTMSSHWCRAFGTTGFSESNAWFAYVRMAIDAGYYGIALVDADRRGLAGNGPNHWVLICGARTDGAWPGNGQTVTGEVLVSCSMRSTGGLDEWVNAREFLRDRGGYNLFLARPA
ncbi:MAG TPA: hypothetical protein VF183_04755 [Acidimicrobiales bacterium]